jgi:uncharacterized protein YkwD
LTSAGPLGKIAPRLPFSLRVVLRSKYVFGAFLAIFRTSASRRLATLVTSVALVGMLPAIPATSHSHVQLTTTLTAGGVWLNRFNAWRANTGLTTLTENTVWSQGDYNHSVYMVKNNLISHSEIVGAPYYTPEGDAAGRNGNIYVSSSTSTSDDQAIDWWMQAPFHAMGMMDPRLTQTGFGSYRDSTAPGWQMAATVDVLRGNPFTGGQYPVYFPANGATEPLRTYGGGESPDPLQGPCAGYSTPTGLPIFVEIGGNVSTTAGQVHSITGNGVALEHCVLDSSSPQGSSLTYRGGVVLIPRQPLQNGVKYVVALTVNGVPHTWSFTVGAFGPPPPPLPGSVSLGGILTSSPDASSWGATRADVFVRGTDNALYQDTWNGTIWTGWTSLGGVLTSGPGAVSWGANRIDVVVRGTDNGLWHRSWNGTAWSVWESLGGILTSSPVVASWGAGRLDVFGRGTDNALWHKWWDGTNWSAWENLGGILTADPGTVSSTTNRLDVVVRGSDNAVYVKSWTFSTGWSGWMSLGGVATTAPDIASCSSGHLDVFVRGTDNGIWQLGFNGSAWTGWKSLGGSWTSGPSAVCRPGTTNIDLFARFTDMALWTKPVAGS